MDKDTLAAALPSVKFLSDKRFKHLFDQHQNVGKAIANSVGWTGKVAWDIYLYYKPYAEWTDKPPKPIYWMHQLTDDWTKNNKYRTGADLKNELYISMQTLLNK
ncbi:MAG: hypothetical protein JRE36_14310 [Deltaproteobacteria bacterium]|nr:hypothetical protein [Deltaproteobacteria bacterium]